MAPPGILTGASALLIETAGVAFGYGLNHDIRDAYIFIANNFEERRSTVLVRLQPRCLHGECSRRPPLHVWPDP
jgi:hypothetical protein